MKLRGTIAILVAFALASKLAFLSLTVGGYTSLWLAVLADVGARTDIDATYHLGDLVGYAPWPNETVALLKGFRIQGIAGNYDSTTATDYKHCGCRYEDTRQEELSHLSYEWTRRNCSPETKRFLGRLPFRCSCHRRPRMFRQGILAASPIKPCRRPSAVPARATSLFDSREVGGTTERLSST